MKIKPTMSMFITIADLNKALVIWHQEREKDLQQKLAEYEKPKNWTRGYNYKGELVKEFALYIPKLILK